MARCKLCEIDIITNRNDIIKNGSSTKHKDIVTKIKEDTKITSMFNRSLDDKPLKAGWKFSAVVASNNLPFFLMDVLTHLCASIFDDSEIAKRLSRRKTKTTHIVRESLGKVFSKNFNAIPGLQIPA